MKYKDYYASLGVERSADSATIKKAYQKLARRYHPDVSKEPGAEEKFKDVAEAWRTLKDPKTRTAYDELGTRSAGQEFEPAQGWQETYASDGFGFNEDDLADLFGRLHRGKAYGRSGARASAAPGEDFEVQVNLSIEDAFKGRELKLELMMPEYDAEGRMRRVATTVHARIPPGATQGQRLRVPGKGGASPGGATRGDLYLTITLEPHPHFRVSGHDLFLDLPIAPWEAVLGTTVTVPTPAGEVRLRVPPGSQNGQQLRLPGRGLPKRNKAAGDLYALIQLVVPRESSAEERKLYQQLADLARFDPRGGEARP